jgi:dihydropteroate synthase
MNQLTFPVMRWLCGRYSLETGRRTLIMGVLNVTPDSFSGDSVYHNPDAAAQRGRQMVVDGADIIDVGGESTRPGAEPVSAVEEMNRVLPVIERLMTEVNVPLSIDTSKAAVARAAVQAGASIINDITGLRGDPEMARVAAESDAGLALMHIQGTPRTMQQNPTYTDLIGDISDSLRGSIELAQRHGVDVERIVIDPGIGFGKTLEHNLQILRCLREFQGLGRPILVGTSRKSFIGKVLDSPVEQRLWGTAATIAIAVANGADIVRVHDVEEMTQVARMTDAIVRPG